MPDEITQPTATDTSSPLGVSDPIATPDAKPVIKFTLEKIDEDNVKKIDQRADVSILNIPALHKEKDDIEAMMAKFKTQLDQINEVLDEFKNLPLKP